ncbi:hypothetical protein [Sphingomonas sp. NPDC079357]|uniref:hypothetical protein n=1 Tax=Sphingomonas sp. NPDC079357 TaxID=3364518 RepID=UPI00384C0CA3
MSRRANPSRAHAPKPAPEKGARRRLDAVAVNAALQKQRAADAADPPTSQLTLMGAIRLIAPLILERRGSGWTGPQIVALLDQSLGITITAETLRVYLHRIERENGGEASSAAPAPHLPLSGAGNAPAAAPPEKRSVSEAAMPIAEGMDQAPPRSSHSSVELTPVSTNPTDEGDVAPRFNPLVDLDEDI